MARRLKSKKLDTRTARTAIPRRREPHWVALSGGLALGYRKGLSGGTWIAKHYGVATGRRYQALGAADDTLDADGKTVLSFDQAQAKARIWLSKPVSVRRDGVDDSDAGPLTVERAIRSYLAAIEDSGRATLQYMNRAEAHIFPKLGSFLCSDLTTKQLRQWLGALAKTGPRIRTKKGQPQRYRAIDPNDEDTLRRRQSSANRVLTILKAGLTHAFDNDDDNKIASDAAWRKVKPYANVDGVKDRYLQVAEAKRLLNASEPDFRKIVRGALLTGARYGQLAALRIKDFNSDSGMLQLSSRKGRGQLKTYYATLTDEGIGFFTDQCRSKSPDDLIFQNTGRLERTSKAAANAAAKRNRPVRDNGAWRQSEQLRPMLETCARANIVPAIGFHGLRHTWASHSVMNGMPLIVVAKNLGHSDTRMVEKHYGHLSPSFTKEAIRAGAPQFGYEPESKVVAIR